MTQQESEALAQFCADQFFTFDSRAWARRGRYDRNASTVAAMYLAMTSWYGHEEELERVAADSRAMHASGEAFLRTSQSSAFDPSVFSQQVRAEIARRRQSSVTLSHANHAATAARNASV